MYLEFKSNIDWLGFFIDNRKCEHKFYRRSVVKGIK